MKPRTKLQQQVYSLSQQLPEITTEQKKWAFKNCLKHIGFRNKKGISCLDCGHVWAGPQTVKTCRCPSCNTKLSIEDTRKKLYSQPRVVVALLDVVDGYQVNRFYEIFSHHRAGNKPRQFIWEIVQQWFVPGEKLTIVGRTQYMGNDSFSGDMEIRGNVYNYYGSHKYNIYADYIFPKCKLLPVFSKVGFTHKVEGNLYTMMNALRNDSIAETLIKANQYQLFLARMGNQNSKVSRFWNSIKICMRQKYIVKESTTWLDYLDLLLYFGKDLRSPKYVCPKYLDKAHDRLVAKKAAILKLEKEKRHRIEAANAEKGYKAEKERFFGLVFTEGNLTINVLETVKEFIQESDAHKHCVFTNKYYDNQYSLCFSAQVDGIRVETVEVSLSSFKVIQSRGLYNRATEHNERIVALVEKNMGMIRQRMRPVRQRNADLQQIGAVA